ncbi:hypothetical protein ABIA35_004500 [Catenulispora sp. MAP12-49]|uniref:hypothetical protein n=1 Tax=Catenulispora sp. MAP12-49 TaxID=3156302 RepID=UPI003511702A
MTPEDSMRDRISAELEAGRPPLGDLVGLAVAEGRRKKRRTRLGAGALSAVGVLAVAGAVAQLGSASPATTQNAAAHPAATTPTRSPSPAAPRSSAPTTPPTTSPTTPTAPATTPLPVAAIVKNVNPGTFSLEKGIYLNYTTSAMSYWEYEGGLTVQYNGSNTWGSDFVTMGATDRLFTGFYVGDKDVAAASMTIDGKQIAATVVKVNGAQGWCGIYYLRPKGATSYERFQIDVYDASGKIIATSYTGLSDGPPPTHSSGEPENRTLPVTNIPTDTPFPGVTVMAPPPGSPTK